MSWFRISSLFLVLTSVLTAAGLSGDKPIMIEPGRMVYPREAEMRGMNGYATVVIEVDETGKLVDWMVTEASHTYFAEGAADIVKHARFRPAQVEGHAIPLRAQVPIEFTTKGIIVNSDFQTIVDLYLQGGHARDHAFRLPTLAELDGIPVPLQIAPPPFPTDLAKQGVVGKVVVDFYIDETGKVRMPAVAEEAFKELGTLALDAVRGWTFAPPLCRGKPTAVRVRQEFRFKEGKSVAE